MRGLLDTSYAARGPSGTAVYIERLADALRGRGNPPARLPLAAYTLAVE